MHDLIRMRIKVDEDLPAAVETLTMRSSESEVPLVDNKVAGARWLRCDLHVHTPFDGEKKFGEDLRAAIQALKKEKPQRLASIAERFVDACRAAAGGEGLDMVALTDHNSIDGYRYLKPQFETLAQQARDQELGMPSILPGVEFSVGGERPIHFLVIFSSSTDPDAIDRAIDHVFGTSDRFDPGTGTPRATGQSVDEFLQRLYEYCRPPSGDRTLEFVVLPAHADGRQGVARELGGTVSPGSSELSVATSLWDEMKGHLRQRVISRRDWHGFQTSRPFDELPQAFKELLWRWAAAKRGQDWDHLSEREKSRYREQRHWALVECSDPHGYEAIGVRYTWLKMEVPDVEGIRLALLDPESRLRRMAEGPPGQDYPRLRRIHVRRTDFFEDIEVPFSPCLTTLIGGRGSGKSTLIEYLRHVLDRDRREDFVGDENDEVRGTVENILGVKKQRDYAKTQGTLLPDYEIDLDLVVSERPYRIRLSKEGRVVLRDQGPSAQEVPLDIRTLLSPRILSQRQIARIVRDPTSQRTELDALLDPDRLGEIDEERRREMESFQQLQGKRRRLRERLKTLPARKTELQKTEDQIAFLEKAGRREVLDSFQDFEHERHWLESTLHEIETHAASLEEQADAVRRGAQSLAEIPGQAPTRRWMETVGERVTKQLEDTASTVIAEAGALRSLAEAVKTERSEQWQPGYETTRTAYDTLRTEMQSRGVDFAQHEKLLQQRMLLKNEVARLEAIGQELEEVAGEIRETRSRLVQVHERRLDLRRAKANALADLDADVRLEILPFRDRKDLESRREEWFSGAGFQERDWSLLMDYLFAPNGSVADRIGFLVEALRADIEETIAQGRTVEAADSQVEALLDSKGGTKLTGHFFRALERSERVRLDEMERFLPEDAVELRVRSARGGFRPITTGSIGEKSTAILSLVLSAGDQPLVIDQPEDDLDNRYIYDVVVSLLRQKKFSRQIVIATHNANIPVNGDAELIVALGVEDRLGSMLAAGSIDRPEVKEQVSIIMEGSAEAFRLRRERYGY